MPSFDVVSELDKHEVTNAVDNAIKELDRRYDLKGKGSFEFKEKDLTVNLTAEADFQLEADGRDPQAGAGQAQDRHPVP